MTEIFLGLGKFFTWTFKIFPIIGHAMDWILFILGVGFFIYFTVKIQSFGQEDRKYKGDFK